VLTVLVVDDEPDILLLHRLNLEAAGHRVVLAADGITALERIAEERPDVVVLDVMMPVLDGWGVLERLRVYAAPPPVLVVSAKSSPADVQRAVDLGAGDYLSKPYDPEELLRRVAALVVLADQNPSDG
jgi:DNA-binding response OmpR family regulator